MVITAGAGLVQTQELGASSKSPMRVQILGCPQLLSQTISKDQVSGFSLAQPWFVAGFWGVNQ